MDIPASDVYIPVPDDQILPGEVIEQVNKLKTSKSPGIDGIPPGILKHLPDAWIIVLTFLMNIVSY